LYFRLDTPSRRKTVIVLSIGNYALLFLDFIQGLVFVPLYIQFLGERLYGLWLGTGGILAVLSFLDLGMSSLNIQRVAREYGKKNFVGIGKYFFNGILISSAFMFIFFLAGLVISNNLDFFFTLDNHEFDILSYSFLLAILSIILQLLNNIVEGTLNALQKPLFAMITGIVANLEAIIFTYILLVKDFSVLAIPIGLIIRSFFALFPNFIYLAMILSKNKIKFFSFDKIVIKDYLSLTPSIFLSKFGTSLVGNIEPTLITMFVSPPLAVYYSVTKKAGGLIRTILDRIGGILFPSFAHFYAENNLEKLKTYFIKFITTLIPISIALFSLYILINNIFVKIWVGSKNYISDSMTLLISVSLILSYYSNLTSYLLGITGDIKYPAFLIFLESIMKLFLLYFLLLLFGIYGLPIAVIISSFIFFIKYIKRWNLHLKLSYKEIIPSLKIILKYSLIIIITTGFSYSVIQNNDLSNEISSYVVYFAAILVVLSVIFIQNKHYIPYFNKKDL